MSNIKTGQQLIFEESVDKRKSEEMGVASPSTKRRLGIPEGDHDVVAAKLARITKNHNNNNEFIVCTPSNTPTPEDSIAVTTDFLTTSILARTLLTSSSVHGPELMSDPLESLKSTLDALPAPCGSLLSPFLKTTISDADNDEFSSLLCHEPPLTPIAVVNGHSPMGSTAGADWSSTLSDGQVITKDENGKSYFNLGSADATIVARKSSNSQNSLWMSNNCANSNNNVDMDDNASSSSCESLSSSEDLFNSGDEFDASDDEEEEFSSYKQQRSTVLHLSLCKLNKFRSQHCVEPSLHRSVLICNTLRHIEQEIKSEDEVDESSRRDRDDQSRERLPSFWRPTSNHHPHCFSSSNSNQPLITDSRPLAPLPSSDPYLSPNPYSSANNPLNSNREPLPSLSISGNTGQPPYLYDYSCLRPTPYHTTSYEYEQDLPSLEATANNSTQLECDSGYGEELSYYYSSPNTTPTNPNSSNAQQQPTQQNHLVVPSTAPPVTAIATSSQFLPFTSSPQSQSNSAAERSTDKPEFESETDSDSSSGSSPPPGSEGWSKEVVPQTPQSSTFAQQDSQCGMESRRSTNLNFSSHSMPMENLISSSYSSSL